MNNSEQSSFSQPESSSSHGNALVEPQPSGNKSLRKRPRLSGPSISEKAEDVEGRQNLLNNIPVIGQKFDIISKIGQGTFSSVYLASWENKMSKSKFAIKHLVPTSSSIRVENEIYCLEKMGGEDHVISLIAYVRHEDHVALIMPYFKHDKFVDCLPLMGVAEMQWYMKALFEALRKVHSHSIIHRDIKPSNFLYNRATRRFQLLDFGLAHLETQTKENRGSILKAIQSKGCGSRTDTSHKTAPQGFNPAPAKRLNILPSIQLQRTGSKSVRQPVRVKPKLSGGNSKTSTSTVSAATFGQGGRQGRVGGREAITICPMKHKVNFVCERCMARSNQVAPRAGTPGFRAPEVLLKYPHQTTAVDMWSAGVILLCFLSGRYPFFKAHDDMSAMAQIVGLFGSKKCIQAANAYGKDLICEPEVPPNNLTDLCAKLRANMTSADNSAVSCDKRHQPNSNIDASCQKRPHLKGQERGCVDDEEKEDEVSSPTKISCKNRDRPLEPVLFSGDPQTESHSCSWSQVPGSAYDLMYRSLDLNPLTRITAEQALAHELLQTEKPKR